MLIEECCGVVKSIQLPENWQAAPPLEPGGGRRLDKYYSIQYPQIRFCSFLRNVPLSKPATTAFNEILYNEFHVLSEEEQNRLEEVIEGMSNRAAFSIDEAYTCYLNSRRVLRITGRWSKTSEKTLSVFVDATGNGQLIQHLYFICPAADFQQLSETAENIFLSLQWLMA